MVGFPLRLSWMLVLGLFWPYFGSAQEQPIKTRGSLVDEALVLVRATEYEKALAKIEKALQQSRREGDRRGELEAMLAMGLALGESGARQRGLQWSEDAIALFESLSKSQDLGPDAGRLRVALARAYRAAGQIERARGELAKAEAFFEHSADSGGLAQAEALLSLLEVHNQRYELALQLGLSALHRIAMLDPKIHKSHIGTELSALSAVAYAEHKLDRLEPALAYYERLLGLAWSVNDQRQIHFAYCNRAEIHWRLGEARPAEEDLRRSIEGWETARARIFGTAEQRAEFLAVQIPAYDRLIRYLAATSRGKEAFEIAERFHARSFLEQLAEPHYKTLAERYPQYWQERQALVGDLGRLRLETDESEALRLQVQALEGKLQAVEARLLQSSPSVAALIEPPSREEIQQGLHANEALISYWLAEDRLFAWVVTQEQIHFIHIPVPMAELLEQLDLYLAPLRATRQAEDLALRGHEATHLETGRQLYRWLIGALPKHVHRAERWIIVPDGALHYLPFESLISDCAEPSGSAIHATYKACNFLGLQKPIIYSSSAGVFLHLRNRHQTRQGSAPAELLALAPEFASLDSVRVAAELRDALNGRAPLLHASEEAKRISVLFSDSNLRLAKQASESRLKREASDYRLLHLATHGLVSDTLPMSSGLLLAEGDGEDGLLQAHEVLGLELTADLVTLSACKTGRGELRGGEGIVGLRRAFLTAGASAVVVSLWDVDDRSTPILMEAFYRQIAEGVAAPEALLAARRRLFAAESETRLVFKTRSLSYAHPRFWSSFVVTGGF